MKRAVLILILSTGVCSAQQITGRVLDYEDKTPLENVTIQVMGSDQGTVSDAQGLYIFPKTDKPTVADSLQFSSIGYTTRTIAFTDLQKAKFVTLLESGVENLNEVAIRSRSAFFEQVPFSKLASLKKAISNFGAVIVNDKIYAVGGDISATEDIIKKAWMKVGNKEIMKKSDLIDELRKDTSWEDYDEHLQVYDIATDTWVQPDITFNKRAYHNINYLNGTLFIMGGKRFGKRKQMEYLDSEIERYDITKARRTVDKSNPHQAVNFASVAYKNTLVVMGGSTSEDEQGTKKYSSASHLFDLESGFWYELADMPKAKETQAVLVNDRIYLLGGFKNEPLSGIERFDLITGEWSTEGDLFTAVGDPAITSDATTIYMYYKGNLCTYNTINKMMKLYHIGLYLEGAELLYRDNTLYLLGGMQSTAFREFPSSNLYSINLSDLRKTKVKNYKNLEVAQQ
ncbi:MAG TPA: hypothetical protein ENH91_10880 [Leeuwenhoekiella sp.]|nr:hypothetical protein [Leeuwenhoekiella sp.]